MRNTSSGASEGGAPSRWAVWSDRLAVAGVVVVLLVLLFMLIDGAVLNFRCSFLEFITFECNRWEGLGSGLK